MWFKNTRTGLTWKITDKNQIKELKKNPLFEKMDGPSDTTEEPDKKETGEIKCDICGKYYNEGRSYSQHRRMAHGINADGEIVDTSKYNAKFNNNNALKEDDEKDIKEILSDSPKEDDEEKKLKIEIEEDGDK